MGRLSGSHAPQHKKLEVAPLGKLQRDRVIGRLEALKEELQSDARLGRGLANSLQKRLR